MNLSTNISFSCLDKHRVLRLPDRLTARLAFETGIDLGDGSLFCSPVVSKRGSGYVYSIAQRFPDEWFGVELLIKPLIHSLYNLMPKSKRASVKRNGINVYTYSRGLYKFKTEVLGLPSGSRSRDLLIPTQLLGSSRFQESFWTGYQYADGSFYWLSSGRPQIKVTGSSLDLLASLVKLANQIGVDFSFGREHHDFGYSLRIGSETSIEKWNQKVPLSNPVHLARFLVWRSGKDCPPALHLTEHMNLLLGLKEHVGRVSEGYWETVRLLALVCLWRKPMTIRSIFRSSNLRSIEEACTVVESLKSRGQVTVMNDSRDTFTLTEQGLERVREFHEFWTMLVEAAPQMLRLNENARRRSLNFLNRHTGLCRG